MASEPRNKWSGSVPEIDFDVKRFNPRDHELASDRQVRLLVRLGVPERTAYLMRKQDASREIDRRKSQAASKRK